ncbi:MAG: hypothetical protein FD128_1863, partial [Hyphomonadaceae bacterium]
CADAGIATAKQNAAKMAAVNKDIIRDILTP